MLHRDSGSVRILGKDNIKEEKAVKERLGVVLGDLNLPETMNGLKINSMMSGIYPGWEEDVFFSNLERFGLPKNRKIKAYSRGMKMKLSIAIALSHGAELLLLDEPTSGLDPIIRDEILDIFLDFIQDENHSIFVSTHIVEDLEKIADYITFIHKGRIILSEEKDTLLERFVILKGPKEGFAAFESSELIGYKENRFGAEAMAEAKVWRKKEAGGSRPGCGSRAYPGYHALLCEGRTYMIGLLKKEYYLMEGQMKSWLIVAVFCFFYSYFMNADSFLFMLIILIGIMSTMTVFSLDKACGWDTYAISLPLTRKEIVEARYLFAFLIDIGVSLACCLLMLLRGLMNGGVNIPESLHSLFQILLVTILMQLLLFPVIYKLGVEKARFVYMAVFICLSLGVLGLSQLDDNGAVLAGIRINAEKIMQYGGNCGRYFGSCRLVSFLVAFCPYL